MNTLADFHDRAAQALRHFRAKPDLQAAVQSETDAFFARFPEVERTELTAAFIRSLVMDRLSINPADSQSALTTETKKVA